MKQIENLMMKLSKLIIFISFYGSLCLPLPLFLIQDKSRYFINVINSSKRRDEKLTTFLYTKTILINISMENACKIIFYPIYIH